VLLGEGTGRFVAERRLDVSGRITSLASGDVNLADGLADLAVGVVAGESSRLLVFEGPGGALRSVPESVDLASPARRITIGQFDGPSYGDLEAVCDGECVVVAGRNRCTLAGPPLVPIPTPEVRVVAESRDVFGGETSLSASLRLNGDAIPDVAGLVPGFDRPALRLSSRRGTTPSATTSETGVESGLPTRATTRSAIRSREAATSLDGTRSACL